MCCEQNIIFSRCRGRNFALFEHLDTIAAEAVHQSTSHFLTFPHNTIEDVNVSTSHFLNFSTQFILNICLWRFGTTRRAASQDSVWKKSTLSSRQLLPFFSQKLRISENEKKPYTHTQNHQKKTSPERVHGCARTVTPHGSGGWAPKMPVNLEQP